MDGRWLHHTVSVPLRLSRGATRRVWRDRQKQRQSYNFGVELELGGHLSKFDAWKQLTDARNNGKMPKHHTRLQRAGVGRGREAAEKHGHRLFGLEQSVEYWIGEVEKHPVCVLPAKNGDPQPCKQLEQDGGKECKRCKAERKLSRSQQRLTEFVDRGQKRLFRSRKEEDTDNGPALIYDEGVNVDGDSLVMPGGLRLVMPAGWFEDIPDGGEFTGAIQIVDVTKRITRKTRFEHRKYEARLPFKVPAPAPSQARCEDDILGVDMGVAIPVMTSEGDEYHLSEKEQARDARLTERIRETQRARARCSEESRRWRQYNRQIAKLCADRANIHRNWSKQTSASLAKSSQAEVAIEALSPVNMMASAKGTAEKPGRNVAQKRGLNRSLARAAMGRLGNNIERACAKRGKGFTRNPPQYTSVTCFRCGKLGIRETQAVFECPSCGLVANADLVGAINTKKVSWARRPGRSSSGAEPQPVGQSSQTNRKRRTLTAT